MPMQWVTPEVFFVHRGVCVYHAYKDEYEDTPLEYWYSTSSTAPSGSNYEFDVRLLLGHREHRALGLSQPDRHKQAIAAALDTGLLAIGTGADA